MRLDIPTFFEYPSNVTAKLTVWSNDNPILFETKSNCNLITNHMAEDYRSKLYVYGNYATFMPPSYNTFMICFRDLSPNSNLLNYHVDKSKNRFQVELWYDYISFGNVNHSLQIYWTNCTTNSVTNLM